MAETQSRIIISAEDRTRAAFAAIERNTAKTAGALGRLQGSMLKLAGAGSLIAFFKHGAESTEKWRDEMARLDDTTKKFFNTAAEAGQLDSLIVSIKGATLTALSFASVLETVGKFLGATASASADFLTGNFREAYRTTGLIKQDIQDIWSRWNALRADVFTEAPRGFAKRLEEDAARTKEAARKMREAEEQRRKATLAAGKPAEDAFRGEAELSEGFTKEGLTALGDEAVNERLEKERELLRRESELRAEQREQDIQALLESQLTEKERADAQHAQDLQTLYDARQAEYLTEVQFKQHRRALSDVDAGDAPAGSPDRAPGAVPGPFAQHRSASSWSWSTAPRWAIFRRKQSWRVARWTSLAGRSDWTTPKRALPCWCP